MKDYFSHDYNSRSDPNLVRVFMKHGLAGIGAYWCIVEMLYEEGGYLPLSEYERITFELRTTENVIQYLISDSDLFSNDGINFWSDTAIERLKKRAEKSQKARESIENRWNKHRNDTNVIRTYNDSNTIKVKESKVKESKEEVKKKTETAKRFLAPTIEDVKSYCLERKNDVDASKWISYYEANGWKVGRNPMKDWKAAIRTWENNGFSNDKKINHSQFLKVAHDSSY